MFEVSSNPFSTEMISTLSANSNSKSSGSSSLTSDMFLQLMVEQLKNQTMDSTMDENQYIGQLVQMSSLESMNTMMQVSTFTYANSFPGKYVYAVKYNLDGTINEEMGLVDSVRFFNGKPQLMINGVAFDLSSVMISSDKPIDIDTGTDPETDTEDGTVTAPGGSTGEGETVTKPDAGVTGEDTTITPDTTGDDEVVDIPVVDQQGDELQDTNQPAIDSNNASNSGTQGVDITQKVATLGIVHIQ